MFALIPAFPLSPRASPMHTRWPTFTFSTSEKWPYWIYIQSGILVSLGRVPDDDFYAMRRCLSPTLGDTGPCGDRNHGRSPGRRYVDAAVTGILRALVSIRGGPLFVDVAAFHGIGKAGSQLIWKSPRSMESLMSHSSSRPMADIVKSSRASVVLPPPHVFEFSFGNGATIVFSGPPHSPRSSL
jgi:hypothetical protein